MPACWVTGRCYVDECCAAHPASTRATELGLPEPTWPMKTKTRLASPCGQLHNGRDARTHHALGQGRSTRRIRRCPPGWVRCHRPLAVDAQQGQAGTLLTFLHLAALAARTTLRCCMATWLCSSAHPRCWPTTQPRRPAAGLQFTSATSPPPGDLPPGWEAGPSAMTLVCKVRSFKTSGWCTPLGRPGGFALSNTRHRPCPPDRNISSNAMAPGTADIHNATITIEHGSSACLSARSGCGKSTLLRCMVAGPGRHHQGRPRLTVANGERSAPAGANGERCSRELRSTPI